MFKTCMHKSYWLSPFCENWTFLRFSYSQALTDIAEDRKLLTFPEGYLKSGCNQHLSLVFGVPLLWPHEHSLLSSLRQIARCGLYDMGFLSSWQVLNEARGNSYKTENWLWWNTFWCYIWYDERFILATPGMGFIWFSWIWQDSCQQNQEH